MFHQRLWAGGRRLQIDSLTISLLIRARKLNCYQNYEFFLSRGLPDPNAFLAFLSGESPPRSLLLIALGSFWPEKLV